MKKRISKNIHLHLGYFYIGLLLAFAISGIVMNHRNHWHPEKFDIITEEIQITLPNKITTQYVKQISQSLQIFDYYKRFSIRRENLYIQYENTEVIINTKTGKGEILFFIKTPIINQAKYLHKNTSKWWIYFSDIFGISLIIISITGVRTIKQGDHSFKRRGWKLAAIGLLFPILFLIFS